MPQTSFHIDRKQASKMLKVSVRTIDRYIKKGKISYRVANGRVWLNRNELMTLKRGADRTVFPTRAPSGAVSLVSLPTTVRKASVETHNTPDLKFYKELYEDAAKQLNETQKKLEQGQYRIGQLESQVIQRPFPTASLLHSPHLPPLPEQEHEISLLQKQLRKEKINRIAFSVIAYILLILQPIFWYFLR